MSQNQNGAKRLTHTTFFQAANCLKQHKQRFLDERPTHRKAAQMLSELSKLQISETTIAELCEATGVQWTPKRSQPTDKATKSNSIRTLTRAVMLLYKKFDEEPPTTLQRLYDILCTHVEPKPEEEVDVENE